MNNNTNRKHKVINGRPKLKVAPANLEYHERKHPHPYYYNYNESTPEKGSFFRPNNGFSSTRKKRSIFQWICNLRGICSRKRVVAKNTRRNRMNRN